MRKFLFMTLMALVLPFQSYTQCNTNNTICTPGVAGPFNLGAGGPQVSTCLNFMAASQYTYIVLYVTQSGPLNLLIDGNALNGFMDVAIFNIPPNVAPCVAIQNNANEIGCNYAAGSDGCNQFGNTFPCPSSVPAPNVVAGQVLMIVVEDWNNGASTNITLQLGPPPGAQTGPPNTTITPVGPYCTTSPPVQLQAVNAGGVWSGNGVSPTGLFNPATAGLGTHTITYSLGQVPCNSSSTTQIVVSTPPIINPTSVDVTCFGDCDGTADAGVGGAGVTYLWTPGGQTTQTINGQCPGNYSVTVTQNGCTSTGNVIINNPPQVIIGGLISHN